jgi:hypothetical protein
MGDGMTGNEREILRFAEWFLRTLSGKCVVNCGRILSSVQFPVFKKFLNFRVKRELQFYSLLLDLASVIHESGSTISDKEIDEVIRESIEIDKMLKRDIILLPLRIDYDYERIVPLRRKRSETQIYIFSRLLDVVGPVDYHEMVRKAFDRDEFYSLNRSLLELYAEEALIINSSIRSFVKADIEEIAYIMYTRMIDVGEEIYSEVEDTIFGNGSCSKN